WREQVRPRGRVGPAGGRGRRRGREHGDADRGQREAARHAPAAPTSAVQKRHRRAASGISLRHSGQSRVVGAGSSLARRAATAFTGFTTKKKTAAAMSTNDSSALMKAPERNLRLLISKSSLEKCWFPPMAAMSG